MRRLRESNARPAADSAFVKSVLAPNVKPSMGEKNGAPHAEAADHVLCATELDLSDSDFFL